MEADTGHTKQLIDDNNVHATRFFPHGRVMYLHGGSLDAPLAFYRMEYSDSLPGPHRVIPHANWRGSYDSGDWNGTCKVIAVTDMLTEPAEENPDPDNPDTWYEEHCLEVFWPAQHLWSAKQFRVGYNAPRTWMGSLITESRDASGLYYRRNRFYDSETGQFTQEDPIGIAGGLNVYGFANGDPITYGDPYGLKADTSFTGAQKGAVARALWSQMRAEAEAATNSGSVSKAAAGFVLLGMMSDVENSSTLYEIRCRPARFLGGTYGRGIRKLYYAWQMYGDYRFRADRALFIARATREARARDVWCSNVATRNRSLFQLWSGGRRKRDANDKGLRSARKSRFSACTVSLEAGPAEGA